MPLPLLTVCLIFLSLHNCFTTFVHIFLNNASRTFPKKKEEIRVNTLQGPVEIYFRKKCLPAVITGLIGTLEKVSKVNAVLCFIRKSVTKHCSVQNSADVNLLSETVGTLILALQHYQCSVHSCGPLIWMCVLPKAISACACPNLRVGDVHHCRCMNTQKASY